MSLILIIDGYNLIRQSPAMREYDREDLEQGRTVLLHRLRAYRRIKQHPVTVVFDGWIHGGPWESKENTAGILVRFSRRGEQADDVIKRLAERHRDKAIVVTSDRSLGEACARQGCAVITAAEFEDRMEMAAYLEFKDMAAEEPETAAAFTKGTKKKGPSRRPPKAKRRRRKVLKKL
jgi:hypothetical protein